MSPHNAAAALERALRAIEPKVQVKSSEDGDEVVSIVSLDGFRMRLRTSYYARVSGDLDDLSHYAKRVVGHLRKQRRK